LVPTPDFFFLTLEGISVSEMQGKKFEVLALDQGPAAV
jgi:hypothetical protein